MASNSTTDTAIVAARPAAADVNLPDEDLISPEIAAACLLTAGAAYLAAVVAALVAVFG